MSLPTDIEAERMVEAVLFAASEPLSVAEIEARTPAGVDVAETLRRIETRHVGRGVVLERIGHAWAFRTAPDLAHLMTPEREKPKKLSRAGLETLAIVAYHQPVTRTEIETIRGVSVSAGTLDLLLDHGWIAFGKRREAPGRPATFITTDAFLDQFGLSSVRDLPGLDDLRASGLLEHAPRPGWDAPLDDTSEAPDSPRQDDLF